MLQPLPPTYYAPFTVWRRVVSRPERGSKPALIIVKPDTVIKWHREGFRLYWRWKSKASIGRPPIDKEVRDLIRRISRENPLWARLEFNRNCAYSGSM